MAQLFSYQLCHPQNVSKLLDLDLIKVDLVSASILPTHGHHINILLITLIT